jgi:serine/threonine-protein kinase HipA
MLLLLTYALRKADCHSKNVALLYTSRADVSLAPVYDFFTTSVYANYQNNPPGISFMGRKTWLPGKTLGKFVTSTFGISQREQKEIVERISDSRADTAPTVRELMSGLAGFKDTGKRMLATLERGSACSARPSQVCLECLEVEQGFRGNFRPAETQEPQKGHWSSRVVGRSQQIQVEVNS